MLGPLKSFFASREGAISTDGVVLAATVVGLGVASVTLVRNGAGNLSGDIRTAAAKVDSLMGNGAEQSDIDENLDVLAIVEAEVARRGLRTDERTPTVNGRAGVTGACGDAGGHDGVGGDGHGFAHDLLCYHDPRLAEDHAAYQDEVARLDPREITRMIEELDAYFHEALERADAQTVTNTRNRDERALAAWNQARL